MLVNIKTNYENNVYSITYIIISFEYYNKNINVIPV